MVWTGYDGYDHADGLGYNIHLQHASFHEVMTEE